MNTSTDKTQNSPDLIDKAEAIGTTLEQAECALNLLFNEYQSSPHLPVFMVINDLIVKAKQQNSALIGDLPKARVQPVFPIIHDPLKDLVTGDIRTEAFELVAITKAIYLWAMNQRATSESGLTILSNPKAIYLWAMNQRATACQLASCDLDSGDMVSLSDLARSKAQRIVELTNEFEGGVTSVGVQA